MDLSRQIERYLLERGDWVSTLELCQVFALPDDRQLRQDGALPGLCTPFAISHTRLGLKHVRAATTGEWIKFQVRLMRHAIAEIRRVRALKKARHAAVYSLAETSWEKDSGQGVFAYATSPGERLSA